MLNRTIVKNPDVQLSMLSPGLGGPFVWIRNEAGNLVLTKLSQITEKAKAALDTIQAGAR